MTKTGFEAFQAQCRYCKHVPGTEVVCEVDCSCTTKHSIPVCTHKDNKFTKNRKTYYLKCRLFRCPFYSKTIRNKDYAYTISWLNSYTKWLTEHKDNSESIGYKIHETAVNRYQDYKVSEEEAKEFFNRNWTPLKSKPGLNLNFEEKLKGPKVEYHERKIY